jgi:hypothetical protein
MHLQMTTFTARQTLRSRSFYRLEQGMSWIRGASLAPHVQQYGAKSPQISNERFMDVVDMQARRFGSLSTMRVSVRTWLFPSVGLLTIGPGGYSSLTAPYGAASGGADGSLLLSDTEIARADHNPMQGFREWLLSINREYKDRGIGAADLVQVAGALAVRSCPGGPIVKTVSASSHSRCTTNMDTDATF